MIFPLALLALAIYLVYVYVTGVDLSTENFPPGPRGLPFVGHLPFLGRNPYEAFAKLGRKYGKIFSVYLGPERVVVLNSSDLIREAGKRAEFSGRPEIDFTAMWAGAEETNQLHGISFNQGSSWMQQRRFALRNLRDLGFGRKSMEDLVLHEVHELVDTTLMSKVNHPMEINYLFEMAVVNALWTLVAGTRFDHDDPKLKELCEEMTQNFAQINPVGVAAFFPKLAQRFPDLLGWTAIMNAIDGIRGLAKDQMVKHKATFDPDYSRDLIDVYLKEIQSTTDPDSSFYKDKGERNLVVTVMDCFGAGMETTSSAMIWACLYLASYPEAQRKVHNELDRVVGRRSPTLGDKANMPYFEATMNEVLRTSGMVPLMLQHRVTEDIEFHGYVLPKGTGVLLNAYCAQRDPEVWEAPLEFRPERFLSSDGSFQFMDAFVAFGTGKRVCLGESLARVSMFLFMANIMHKFFLELPAGPKPSQELGHPGIVIRPHPFNIILRKRFD